MRNTLSVLLVASVLVGCLDSGEPGSDGFSGAADNQLGNNPPTIGGSPSPAILVNDTYEFAPSAADADGDPLTFRIQNKPRWASFDSSTGQLSGQPTLGDVGTYENIVITVSDGTADQSLSAFSITVSQSALGNVTLSWVAPTENSDGSPLNDLAGYKIYYGKSSGVYDHEIRLDNPGLTTYVVENLVPDTYFFAAQAFNSAGVDSTFSGEAVRSVY
jgi:hypothetical protein